MEQQDLIESLARAKWEFRRQTPWGVYSGLPPWEEESDSMHEELCGEVQAVLDALDAAGFAIVPK